MPEAEASIRRAVLAALHALELPAERPVEVGVLLSDDRRVRILNRDWRGQDKPTNVLSFPAGDANFASAPADRPLQLGDVVLSLETVLREAAARHKPVADHLTHLIVHGVLHLGGYDHQDDLDATEMESLERGILAGLGVADPYFEDVAEDGPM